MRFGVCGSPDNAPAAKTAGFEYMEWSVGGLLKPLEPETAFREALARVRAAPLPVPALNVFLPGDLKLTGPTADLAKLETYVTTAFRRAEEAGVDTIVFGSGGARRIPDGTSTEAAWRQLTAFGRMIGPLAAQHGVTIVIEPLRRAECNVINSVDEGARLAKAVAHPAVRLLVDGYHWAVDGDRADDIVAQGALLAHTHIATTEHRMAPGMEAYDAAPFFAALRQAKYAGRMSIEGNCGDHAQTLAPALRLLREWAG